jgi:hypothetical protein
MNATRAIVLRLDLPVAGAAPGKLRHGLQDSNVAARRMSHWAAAIEQPPRRWLPECATLAAQQIARRAHGPVPGPLTLHSHWQGVAAAAAFDLTQCDSLQGHIMASGERRPVSGQP